MYQDVAKDMTTLLQLFTRGATTATNERFRRVLLAVLAAVRLRVLLCRWFLAQAQRPVHPLPHEQEALLRVLLQQQQHGGGARLAAAGGESPPVFTRMGSGGSAASASVSSTASSPASSPVVVPFVLPSPKSFTAAGGGGGGALGLLLEMDEAVAALEEDLAGVEERVAACVGEDGEVAAWTETVAAEARAVLSGRWQV